MRIFFYLFLFISLHPKAYSNIQSVYFAGGCFWCVEEVFEKTSLSHAPWYLIPSNKKWSRNLLIAQIICATLDNLHLTYPKVKFNSDDTLIT